MRLPLCDGSQTVEPRDTVAEIVSNSQPLRSLHIPSLARRCSALPPHSGSRELASRRIPPRSHNHMARTGTGPGEQVTCRTPVFRSRRSSAVARLRRPGVLSSRPRQHTFNTLVRPRMGGSCASLSWREGLMREPHASLKRAVISSSRQLMLQRARCVSESLVSRATFARDSTFCRAIV